MKTILSQLLFDPVAEPISRGRQIRFDVDEPDILVATGVLEDRISTLMYRRAYPMTAREIAVGIASNPSQVNRGLRSLIAQGKVDVIEIDHNVREYVLKPYSDDAVNR